MVLLALLALARPADAATVNLRVGGLGSVTSVIGVVRDGDGALVEPCNDAAKAPDTAVDGVWTCTPANVSGDVADVVAIVDGRLVDGGVLTWDAGAPHDAVISVASGIVQASKDLGALHVNAGATAAPGLPIILARLTGYGTGPAAVLNVGSGGAQLFCHDDGQFPDRLVNDGEPACSGGVAGEPTDLAIRAGDGKMIPVGKIVWRPGPIQYATVDVKAATSSSDPFDLPLPPLPALGSAPAAVAPSDAQAASVQAASSSDGQASAEATTSQTSAATASQASTASSSPASPQPAQASSGQPSQGGGQPNQADASPTHLVGVGDTPFGPWPWLFAVLGVGGAVVALRLRRDRVYAVRPTLRPHPAPPLFPGGPGWTEAAILRAPDPVAFFTATLSVLAERHRVVVVLPGLVELPPVGGAGVWVTMVPTWEEVAAGVVGLARTEGAPVAVLILGAETVTDPGAVAPDALGKLSRGLPPGVWMGVVLGMEEPLASWMPVWRVSGPPWEGVRA